MGGSPKAKPYPSFQDEASNIDPNTHRGQMKALLKQVQHELEFGPDPSSYQPTLQKTDPNDYKDYYEKQS